MKKFARVGPLIILISLASACENTKSPVEVVEEPALNVTAGVYDLSASMPIDPTFADFSTFSYSSVLTIAHEPTDASRLTGPFTDWRIIIDGQESSCCGTGFLVGRVDRDGRVSLELKRDDSQSIWVAAGVVSGTRIEGKWKGYWWGTGELTGDLGPFTAELRKNP